ncbi:MAG: M48 family metalloprotease [Sedimentisphaerales bacterium]|nr:M48 family metalloprotease [Sedimentisphaerales bacterium]
MSSLFYNLGRKVGPTVRKAKWIWQSVTGGQGNAIRVENEVGRDLAREIRNQLEPDSDETTIQLLNEIGSNLAGCVANKLRTFSFEVVKSAEPNAFALPGGFIFVTRPLVELCDWNRDELAFILGHEMAHVIREHAIKRIVSNSAVNVASCAVPIRGQISGWLRKVGVKFLESAYSQEIESQADRLGVRLVAAAGYDVRASVRLLGRLNELALSERQFRIGSYFSSHPAFEERINDINRLLQKRESERL